MRSRRHCIPPYHSSAVVSMRSTSVLFLLLLSRSTGSSLISTPGPIVLELLPLGHIYSIVSDILQASSWSSRQASTSRADFVGLTFVPPHPSRNANSCAKSSPNPSIIPFTKGNSRFIAAPRSNDQIVGGWYMITGRSAFPLLFVEDCGGEEDGGESEEYGSESEGMVSPEAERS